MRKIALVAMLGIAYANAENFFTFETVQTINTDDGIESVHKKSELLQQFTAEHDYDVGKLQTLQSFATRMQLGLNIDSKALIKLLNDDATDINAFIKTSGEFGKTLLHYAVEYGYVPEAKIIIEYGKNVDVDKESFNGKRPIQIAQEKKNTALVKLLSHAGADQGQNDNGQDEDKEVGGGGGGDSGDDDNTQGVEEESAMLDEASESATSDESEELKELREREQERARRVNAWMSAIMQDIEENEQEGVPGKQAQTTTKAVVKKKESVITIGEHRVESVKKVSVERSTASKQTEKRLSSVKKYTRETITPSSVEPSVQKNQPVPDKVFDVPDDTAAVQRARQAERAG